VLSGAFQENAARIYRFIYAKVGNREDAEDLTSQVFLKAIGWLADGRDVISIRSWLYRTARSVLVDYWREQGRLDLVPLTEGVQPTAHDKDHRRAPWHTRARALRILDALPERERAVLRLRFLQGYTTQQIAQVLGLTPSHVRALQLRARHRAARCAPGPPTRDRDNSTCPTRLGQMGHDALLPAA
jgi:RNA polymerase sigma-70 factor (ECF subfamily)